MAVNCNTIVPFEDATLEVKSSLGRSASMAVHGALGDCYKAIETLEMNGSAAGAEVVYFRGATNKLETAAQALRRMREILSGGKLPDTAVTWVQALDYDRLYETGRKRRLIPAGTEQWNRLVELMTSRDHHLAVTDSLITEIGDLRREIDSTVDTLLSATPGVTLTREQAERLLIIQTALVQFSTFAQMVAYLNAVEPMDKTWYPLVDMADSVKLAWENDA